MKKFILQKIIDNYIITRKFVYYKFPILIILITIFLFFVITSFSPEVVFFDIDPSASGFKHFTDTYNFVLKFMLYSITTWGILVALLKYKQSDIQFNKQFDLNQKIFETTNRPYLAIDKLEYKYDKDNTLILDITLHNFGTLPAKISRLYWEMIVHTERKMFIAKDLKYETIYPKKSKEINSPSSKWADISMDDILIKEAKLPAVLILDIEYLGLGKIIYRTKEKYFCECKKDYFELIETDYELTGHYF
ncbi:MAG: hypothetical protein GF353_23595 [Candidatus Lokiarchaeota archaeon]|nr:hypothetical protein [Candidatus Lokiarchaeota archaeon]